MMVSLSNSSMKRGLMLQSKKSQICDAFSLAGTVLVHHNQSVN